MKKFLAYAAASVTALLTAAGALALDGAWRGNLNVGQASLPLVFNFSTAPDGTACCTLDSPEQGVKGIEAKVAHCSADSVAVDCPMLGAAFRGHVTPQAIDGIFSQRGYNFPLTLTPEEPLEVRRPQTPRPPFPYTVTDTTFTAPDGAVLSGTLTLPPLTPGQKVPAVIMVSGSGAQNRDEELFEHRPFAVIADYLARNGVASLRYDDRGTARSGGDYSKATTYTLKDDAAAALALLRSLPAVDKAGVLGHSEGGTIAFMLGAEGKPDFIVTLGGMAVGGKETLMQQNARALKSVPMTDEEHAASLRLVEMLLDTLGAQWREGKTEPIDMDAIARENSLTVPVAVLASLRSTSSMRSPWFDAFAALDPRPCVRAMRCPALAINGSLDTQVDPANLEEIKRLNPKVKTLLMPGLNHLLQPATTGDSSEYAQIRQTIDPSALAAILAFIQGL